jgi:hypothetical protein
MKLASACLFLFLAAMAGPFLPPSNALSADLPDLVVTGTVFIPASPKVGDYIDIDVTVKNQGAGRAIIRNGQKVLFLDQPFYRDLTIESDIAIEPGASRVFRFIALTGPNAQKPAGTYSLKFSVNPDNKVQEVSFANNSAVYPLTIAPNPAYTGPPVSITDLALESCRIEPSKGTVTTKYALIAMVRNLGNTPERCADMGIDYGKGIGTAQPGALNSAPWLQPGQVYEWRFNNFTFPAGRLNVTFIANYTNIKSDSNQANNYRTTQVEVVDPAIGSVGQPDLRIYGLTKTSYEIPAGSPFVFNSILENAGDGPALLPIGTTVMQLEKSGVVLGHIVTGADLKLVVNGYSEARSLTLPAGTLAPGVHSVLYRIDPANAAHSSTATGKTALLTLNVKGPDLAVTSVTASPSSPNTASPIALTVTLKNNGPVQASIAQGSPLLAFGAQGFSRIMPTLTSPFTLAPGQEYKTSVTVPAFTKTPGTYSIQVSADPYNRLNDPAQANNAFTLPVTVVAPSIQSIQPSSTTTSPVLSPLQSPTLKPTLPRIP